MPSCTGANLRILVSLTLFRNRLFFQGVSQNTSIPFESISAVTIESNTVIVDRKDGPTLYFDFLEESGKKWEDCIQKAIAEFYHPADIVEFCPKIRFSQSRGNKGNKNAKFHEVHVAAKQWYRSDSPLIRTWPCAGPRPRSWAAP